MTVYDERNRHNDPPLPEIHWPTLLRQAEARGSRVFRTRRGDYPRLITTPPEETRA